VSAPTTEELRQRLRDYAREDITLTVPTDDGAGPVKVFLGLRGEHGGRAIVALQNILSVIESLETEGNGPVTVSASDPVALAEQRGQKWGLRRVARELRACLGRDLNA
jgi:hypothetical protein